MNKFAGEQKKSPVSNQGNQFYFADTLILILESEHLNFFSIKYLETKYQTSPGKVQVLGRFQTTASCCS